MRFQNLPLIAEAAKNIAYWPKYSVGEEGHPGLIDRSVNVRKTLEKELCDLVLIQRNKLAGLS
jgi:hypothetical protein